MATAEKPRLHVHHSAPQSIEFKAAGVIISPAAEAGIAYKRAVPCFQRTAGAVNAAAASLPIGGVVRSDDGIRNPYGPCAEKTSTKGSSVPPISVTSTESRLGGIA